MNREDIAKINPSAILWDNYDDAIIGMATKEVGQPIVFKDENNNIIDIKLEPLDDEDDNYDRWGRESFGPIVAYDINKIITILMEDMEVDEKDLEEGITVEDEKFIMAYEYYDYNIVGGWVGEYTPIHFVLEN